MIIGACPLGTLTLSSEIAPISQLGFEMLLYLYEGDQLIIAAC